MSARGIAWGLLLWLAACGRPAPAADPEAPPQAPAPAASEAAAQTTTAPAAEDTAADGYEASPSRRGPEGQEIFGGDIDWSAPEVSLASMLAEPDRFAGRKVRTRGVIGRVCQRQGCWMELRGEGAEEQKPTTVKRSDDKVGRNDPCPCGSGKKYKKCHGK